jgi:hypothetical protein
VQSNTTDNESGFIKSAKRYIQGYNGVTIADSGSQVIMAAEVTGGAAGGGMFPQMLNTLEESMKALTGKEEPLKKAIAAGGHRKFQRGQPAGSGETGSGSADT